MSDDKANPLPPVTDLGTFTSEDTTVGVSLVPPNVRIFVDQAGEWKLDLRADISAYAATVLSLALAGLAVGELGDFIAALRRAEVVMGVREELPDYYDTTTFLANPSALQAEADSSTRHDEEEER